MILGPPPTFYGVRDMLRTGSARASCVVQVRPGGRPVFGRLGQSMAAGLPVPGMAVVIDYCGEVRLPSQPWDVPSGVMKGRVF